MKYRAHEKLMLSVYGFIVHECSKHKKARIIIIIIIIMLMVVQELMSTMGKEEIMSFEST
jgi:hypothetical protein